MKYFDWTEEKNYTLALLLLKYKGYKTTDIKQLEKWETILDKIKTKPGFDDLAIKPIPLQTHFKRMQEETLRACGISMEGANLSGLEEEQSELVKLLINMAEDLSKEKKHKGNGKKKKAEKNKAMTIYEKLQLAEQWRNAVAKELGLIKEESPAQPLFDGYVPSTDLPSKATSSSSDRKAGRSFLDEFRSDLHAVIIDGDDDEDEKASEKQKLNSEEKKLELMTIKSLEEIPSYPSSLRLDFSCYSAYMYTS